jgi:hypothetical protein
VSGLPPGGRVSKTRKGENRMSATTERRRPPSWLWGVPEAKRQELLSKRDSNGQAVWKIIPLPERQVLQRPISSTSDTALAKLGLLAEIRQDAVTCACESCGAPMGAERAKQTCEKCGGEQL